MHQTVNINMGGRLFIINDDAYQTLSSYMETLHQVLDGKPEGPEIIGDIECRISELLDERLVASGEPAVTLQQVRETLACIGRPDDFLSEEEAIAAESVRESSGAADAPGEDGTTANAACSPGSFRPAPESGDAPLPMRKKFFRNPDGALVGGLCSGLAVYLGIDVVWIRIAFVALCFLSASTCILVYIVLCCIVPQARTPLQKMEMYGESPTLSNIERNVYESQGGASGQNNGTLMNLLGLIGKIVIGFFVGLGLLVGGCCALGLISLLLIGLCAMAVDVIPCWVTLGWYEGLGHAVSYGVFQGLGAAFILIAVGMPCLVLSIGFLRSRNRRETIAPKTAWWLLGLWILSIVLASVCLAIR